MIYNAGCLASNQSTLEESISGIQLRYSYLKRFLEMEHEEGVGRELVTAVLPISKKVRFRRPRALEDVPDDEMSERQHWVPPPGMGSYDMWIKERDSFWGT